MTLKEPLVRFRSFWMFPLLAVVLVYLTKPYRDLLWLFPIGVLIWTLLEYGLHRFLFHIRVAIKNPRLREAINASHSAHHASPKDADKLLVHPSYGLVISAILFGVFYVVAGSVSASVGLLTGVWAGFLYYESVHYRVHFNVATSRLIVMQRRLHFYHHFTNNKRYFGVTSPLWDYAFGTALGGGPGRSEGGREAQARQRAASRVVAHKSR